MRIKSIEVKNFKSLVDFKLDLAKFSCLIGLNGSGKSTVLQFFDFLSQLVRGDIRGWLEERHWNASELQSGLGTHGRPIEFRLTFEIVGGGEELSWKAEFSAATLRCMQERIEIGDYLIETDYDTIHIHRTIGVARKSRELVLATNYEGSILSSIKEGILPDAVLDLTKFLIQTESLEPLAPESLRNQALHSRGGVGPAGRDLSAFWWEMPEVSRFAITEKLRLVYPQLQNLQVIPLASGMLQLEAVEAYGSQALTTEARHLNDGLLRLIAVLAQVESDREFIVFDEVENGINPELVQFVLEQLVNAKQQVLVTTHSPMILNYLSDEVAKDGVVYLYKTSQGHTKSIPFFSIPSLAEKLKVMGPGEAFVDTNLTALADEIESVTGENS